MKILFIYVDLNIDPKWQGHYYEGIASLSAILKARGHTAELAHIYNLSKAEKINKQISHSFDLIAFSCTTPMFPFVQWCAEHIKKQFKDIPLLCGGSHPTLSPYETLEKSVVDYVCVGEGEYFILEFLEFLQGSRAESNIKGLAYKKGTGEIVINELRPPIDPLDDLPFPDRELFDLQHKNQDFTYVSAGRGCPNQCAYCSNNKINEMYRNKYLRIRKPETVIKEVKLLLDKYPHINYLYFSDDVFVLNKSWLADFCKLYAGSVGLPFCALAYPTTITDEVVKMLKGAGCQKICFGIQSGNEFIRNEIMLRRVSNKRIRESIGILKKYDLEMLFDVIFGVPTETKKQMLDTIKLCAENGIKPKSHIFYPLPATKLEKMSIEMGLFDKSIYGEDYHGKTILKYPKIHKARILFFHRYSDYLVLIYNFMGYGSKIFLPKKASLFLLDKILCNDLAICAVIVMRSIFIKIRGYFRKLSGVYEYRLEGIGG